MRRFPIVLIVLSFLALACEEPFSAKGEFRDELVVYAILSNISDTQYARVYRTYNPSGFDPFEQRTDNPVVNALIQVSQGGRLFSYRDTVVARKDTSRYKTPINAYIAAPFPVEKGKTYTIDVQAPDGKRVTATVSVPASGYVDVRNPSVLRQPTKTDIVVWANLSSNARGYFVRLFLIFEVFENGAWVSHRMEVPSYIKFPGTPNEEAVFPDLKSAIAAIDYFEIYAYTSTITKVYREYGTSVRFISALFVLIQVEQHLYNYYNIANGFRDPNSIRVDEPDYGNILSGAGVFGAFAEDSVAVALPAAF